MKVLMINGSPHPHGCTYTALKEIAGELERYGIESEIVTVGNQVIAGCIGCRACSKTGRCFRDDIVNEVLDKADEADGFIFGSPVHFASPSGAMISFMDRMFYAGGTFAHKPASVIVSARRAGTTASLDALLKYPMYMEMPVISAHYWNMVHGNSPEDVMKDEEGLHTMRTIGKNMAWILQCIEAGKQAGIEPEKMLDKPWTNFIR
ncbi:MAG: flavodoxin family protein [Firmicutes bacterium]|nr:flavodoxin family protein [Bacillota bacterium]